MERKKGDGEKEKVRDTEKRERELGGAFMIYSKWYDDGMRVWYGMERMAFDSKWGTLGITCMAWAWFFVIAIT